MLIIFDKQTSKRITDFGSNVSEMTDELWQYMQEKFNLAEVDVLLGHFDDNFEGKDISQMVAVIESGVVVGWNAPDFVPEPPEPQPPTEVEVLQKETTSLRYSDDLISSDLTNLIEMLIEKGVI